MRMSRTSPGTSQGSEARVPFPSGVTVVACGWSGIFEAEESGEFTAPARSHLGDGVGMDDDDRDGDWSVG
ncbi:hypothetical protein MLD38_006908 [Melastoma candidum]|uniref:Uncharacterized protein n=1 Tax=Melastoma candidum TaxID=119954 RepID=A0ACB9RPC5_9MYRT|nr:hypothetical protein MLD38_006908 [Melastoma candidum]